MPSVIVFKINKYYFNLHTERRQLIWSQCVHSGWITHILIECVDATTLDQIVIGSQNSHVSG